LDGLIGSNYDGIYRIAEILSITFTCANKSTTESGSEAILGQKHIGSNSELLVAGIDDPFFPFALIPAYAGVLKLDSAIRQHQSRFICLALSNHIYNLRSYDLF
jgi:hypothetical protein